MIGIIMAGGRGSRMTSDVEKPLIKVGGKTMLACVAQALIKASLEVVIAVSNHTPKTALKAREMGFRVVESPGDGYVRDIQFLLRELSLNSALVVSADLPFISPRLIKDVVKKYDEIKKPICVAVTEEDYRSMGFTPTLLISYNNTQLTPVGVNVVEKEEKEDYFYITPPIREIINVNTIEELKTLN